MAVGWRRQSLEIVRRLARNDGRDRGDNVTPKDGGDSPDNIKANKGGTSESYALDCLARASVKMSTLDRFLAWVFVHTRQPVSTVEARVAPTPRHVDALLLPR